MSIVEQVEFTEIKSANDQLLQKPEPLKQTKPSTDSSIKKKSTIWIVQAVLAGLTMGYGNFTMSTISNQGIKTLAYIGLASYLILLIYRVIQCLSNRKRLGTFINYEKSNLFQKNGKFNWKNLFPLVGNGVTNLFNLVTITYAFKFAVLGGINQGVILALTSMSSVYNIFIFYFLFKEKVGPIQVVGILIMMCCAGCIGFNSQQRNDNLESGDSQRWYASLSVFFSLLSPFFMSSKHVIIRKYKS